MLLMTNFPPDIRVEKEICSLSKRNDLHILCTGRKGEPELDEFEGQKLQGFQRVLKDLFLNWKSSSSKLRLLGSIQFPISWRRTR